MQFLIVVLGPLAAVQCVKRVAPDDGNQNAHKQNRCNPNLPSAPTTPVDNGPPIGSQYFPGEPCGPDRFAGQGGPLGIPYMAAPPPKVEPNQLLLGPKELLLGPLGPNKKSSSSGSNSPQAGLEPSAKARPGDIIASLFSGSSVPQAGQEPPAEANAKPEHIASTSSGSSVPQAGQAPPAKAKAKPVSIASSSSGSSVSQAGQAVRQKRALPKPLKMRPARLGGEVCPKLGQAVEAGSQVPQQQVEDVPQPAANVVVAPPAANVQSPTVENAVEAPPAANAAVAAPLAANAAQAPPPKAGPQPQYLSYEAMKQLFAPNSDIEVLAGEQLQIFADLRELFRRVSRLEHTQNQRLFYRRDF